MCVIFIMFLNSSCTKQMNSFKSVAKISNSFNGELKLFNREQPPFDINGPDVTSFYPVSEAGHVASLPFYLKQAKQEESGIVDGIAWWQTAEGDEGTYHIVFKATDSKGATAEQTVTIKVIPPPHNPPTLFVKK